LVFPLTCNKLEIGKYLSDVCPLFIQKTAEIQEGLKLNSRTSVVGITMVYSCQNIAL